MYKLEKRRHRVRLHDRAPERRRVDLPYDGPELQHFMIVASSFGVAEALEADNLAYKSDEVDALSMILCKAIELGMQRAFRMVEQRPHMLGLYELKKCSPGLLQTFLDDARERGEAPADG